MTNRQATPVYRVLLIGIDAYPSVPGKPIRQLGGCVADVDYLARTLGSLAIPEAAMTRLVAPRDRQSEESELPTRERILAALDALASEPIENTRTIVFYAGHGVHVRSSVTGAWSEGMVAADGQVIWDWELSPRFAAIHRNSESLTLLLDACGAAGLPRSGEVTEDALRARWVPLDELGPQVSSVTAAGSGDADRGLFSNDQMRGYTTMAAANRDELAYERNVGGVTLGIFTRALCMTLEQHRAELHARCADPLRWVDVENDLREHVQHALRDFKMEQTPQLLGPPNNRVLGGPPGAWCDAVPCVEVPGRAVPTYQISGGWMAGFEEDAIVELHRQLPDRPRVPQEDAAADEPTHELIVTASARPGSSEAKLRRAAPVALPPRGYARVIRPRALRVGLSAAVPAELQAALLERAEEDGLVYLPGMERGEASRAEQAEAYLGFDDNTVWLGDSLYGWDPVTTPGPLWQRSYAGSEARFIMGVRAVLRHAARFLIPIRSVRRAEREGFLSRNLALSVHRVVPGTPEQSVQIGRAHV